MSAPLDPELEVPFGSFRAAFPALTDASLGALRQATAVLDTGAPLRERGIVTRDVTIPRGGDDQIIVSVLEHPRRRVGGPVICHLHGGGMVFGDRWGGVAPLLDWVERDDAVVVTVDYRPAPEHPDPVPVEDCYAGLLWLSDHVDELGVDRDRIVVAGQSAGGGLAAGIALLARDRGGPRLSGQLLLCPMLDDRDTTTSTHQHDGTGGWDRAANLWAWTALLGSRRATADVSPYAAPARTPDHARLPPAYIECGSAELFRDENVAFATELWKAGGQAELHVWAGAFHGFDVAAPEAAVTRAALDARNSWWTRHIRPAVTTSGAV